MVKKLLSATLLFLLCSIACAGMLWLVLTFSFFTPIIHNILLGCFAFLAVCLILIYLSHLVHLLRKESKTV